MQRDPNDPYRAGDKPAPTELERLAAEGDRKHALLVNVAAREADRSASDNLALAIGGHFGTPLLRGARNVQYAALAVVAIQLLFLALGVAIDPPSPRVSAEVAVSIAVAASVVAFVLVFVRLFLPPKAPTAACDAEAAWVRSLTFRMSGYFEALCVEPTAGCTIQVVLEWAPSERAPEHAVLLGVIRGVDPAATDLGFTGPQTNMPSVDRGVRWRTGSISGTTNITVNDDPIYRNHGIVKYVHALVDGVLVPINRDYPIARVTLTRN